MGISDEAWMREAILQARHAYQQGEVPIGCVIVKDDKLLAKGYNRCISDHDPTAHAEVVAIRCAGDIENNYRLIDTIVYTTLEPCAMCAVALVHARVKRVVFAAYDAKQGACGSCFQLADNDTLNHQLLITGGVCEEESRQLLQSFFKARR